MNEIFAGGRRPVAFPLVAFISGAGFVQVFESLPATLSIIALAFAALVLAGLRRFTLAALLAGMAWALCLAQARLSDALPSGLEQAELQVEGTVASVPEAGDADIRFLFDIDTVLAPRRAAVPRRVRLTWYRAPAVLKAGERWRLALKLKRPHGMMNPGGMDYELWLFAHGIRATGYVRDASFNGRILAAGSGLGFQSWRQSLNDILTPALREARFGGILKALVFGDESEITPDQWEVLRRTGTAHLVAISGSHIALIAAWCFALGSKLSAALAVVRWAPMTVGAWTGFIGALLYSGLADFAIPTRRALVMVAVVMAGIILKRPVRPFHLLLLAAFAVVCVDPLALLAPGFWLSFVAVAAILWVMSHRLRMPGPLGTLWRVNWATAVALAPLLLLFFRQIPLLSPLANLIAVPLFGVVLVPMCLVGVLLVAMHPLLGGGVFALADGLLGILWRVLEAFSAWPGSQWTQAQPPIWSVVLALIGAAIVLAPRGLPARWLGWFLFAPALTWQADRPPAGMAELTVLDVGQGLATVVRTQGHTLVFDAGARFSDRFDIGSAVLWPFLTDASIDRVDTLVISHADNDHMGGAEPLYRRMAIGLAYSSAPEVLPTKRALPCQAGQEWQWDGVHFEFLSPLGPWGNDNDRSCVLRVSAGSHSALLTGDIEALAEERLVQTYGDRLDSDVLVVPHHGSDSSSTAAFIDRVSPAYALVSAGYLNRYGFPARTVLQRYRNASVTVLNTADSGSISLKLGASSGPPNAERYRSRYRRYWHWRP